MTPVVGVSATSGDVPGQFGTLSTAMVSELYLDAVSVHDAVTAIQRHWGGIDILVNNAGVPADPERVTATTVKSTGTARSQ